MKSTDIKTEKANAIFKYQTIQKITKLFQFMEVFFFFAMISRFSSQLPPAVNAVIAVNVSVDYFRGISFTLFSYFSPKFMFVIGNLLILILFFKSRVDKIGDGKGNGNGTADLCYEFVKSYDMSVISYPTSEEDLIVASNKRRFCRSKSENPMRTKGREKQTHRELRRSVTEISRSEKFGGGDGGTAAVDGDEFRRTVEAFIARRQKLLRDEEFSPMVCIEGS
ncbi:hypothetical protein SSX86_006642 [Deinandra increscens subsp. villosa]|uniref:DUF4408 domain-containing protein n=1 Tax=Deinandra increscens subsp. villosa TaxID=3103831 RepID=A0AAP0DGF4_9ASTR